jgi:hypothetical protein
MARGHKQAAKFKRVLRYDPSARKFRLCRWTWQTGEWQPRADVPPYSHKLSVALRPRLFRLERRWDGWRLVLLGLEIHREWSWGGTLV